MRSHEIEAWSLAVIDRVGQGLPVEDGRVELKALWTGKAVRRRGYSRTHPHDLLRRGPMTAATPTKSRRRWRRNPLGDVGPRRRAPGDGPLIGGYRLAKVGASFRADELAAAPTLHSL